MRDFEHKRTKTKCGQELSQLFIGEDGLLSVFLNDEEHEVIGFQSSIFIEAFACKEKYS